MVNCCWTIYGVFLPVVDRHPHRDQRKKQNQAFLLLRNWEWCILHRFCFCLDHNGTVGFAGCRNFRGWGEWMSYWFWRNWWSETKASPQLRILNIYSFGVIPQAFIVQPEGFVLTKIALIFLDQYDFIHLYYIGF